MSKSHDFKFTDVISDKPLNVYDGFFKVNQYKVKHAMYGGGQSEVVTRELFERGDAVAVLPFDAERQEVVLVEQFRIGCYGAGIRDQREGVDDNALQSPWLIECIAGMIDKGRGAEEVAIAEAKEEAGIEISALKPVMRYFSTPGGMSERVHLFVALTDSSKVTGFHGLDCEHEDIRPLRVPIEQAFDWVETGKINNATTVIALQWLQLNKHRWPA